MAWWMVRLPHSEELHMFDGLRRTGDLSRVRSLPSPLPVYAGDRLQ